MRTYDWAGVMLLPARSRGKKDRKVLQRREGVNY